MNRARNRACNRACFRFALSLATFALACGDDDAGGGDVSRRESVADALTRSVKFARGRSRDGDLAALDPAAATVTLDLSAQVVDMSPGAASLLGFDVQNPDGNEPVVATLLQFEGADSHTSVPVSAGDAGVADGGAADSELHVENGFEVADDVCEHLCNQRFMARLEFAVELEGGAVSGHRFFNVVLDCRQKGNPDLCGDDGSGKDGGEQDDGGSSSGSGGSSAGGSGGSTSAGSGALDAGPMASDGGVAMPGENGPPPQLGLLTPQTATSGQAFDLTIDGSGFAGGALVYVDGVAVETTVVSDTSVSAQVPASSTANAGSLYVYVENFPGDETTQSNVLYVQVAPAPGAPIIYDYSPDNGVPGDTVLIIASNLAGQTLTIEDAEGHELEPGTLGTIGWPTVGTVDTVAVVLPDDIASGPITIGNSLGSYRGKIFSVGMNLTRAGGTVVDASSEYSPSPANWSKVSGADNNLATSYFTANGDCATATSCTSVPMYSITFSDVQTVGRIAMRGNREYAGGYDFIRGTFELRDDGDDVLWEGTYDLPAPDRDLDIVLTTPVEGVSSLHFISLEDESTEPGFAELEVFGP